MGHSRGLEYSQAPPGSAQIIHTGALSRGDGLFTGEQLQGWDIRKSLLLSLEYSQKSLAELIIFARDSCGAWNIRKSLLRSLEYWQVGLFKNGIIRNGSREHGNEYLPMFKEQSNIGGGNIYQS
jgi:hypothetical protein